MNVYLLLCALRTTLTPELDTLPLAVRTRNTRPEKDKETVRPARLYIGELPPKQSGEDEAVPPFVVLQELDGKHMDGFHHVRIGMRASIWNEEPEGAVNDLHNLMSLLTRTCGPYQRKPLQGRYSLEPDDDGALCSWFRPDEQNPPYREGYIITRWKMAGLE